MTFTSLSQHRLAVVSPQHRDTVFPETGQNHLQEMGASQEQVRGNGSLWPNCKQHDYQVSRKPKQDLESQEMGSRRLWCTPQGLLENLSLQTSFLHLSLMPKGPEHPRKSPLRS